MLALTGLKQPGHQSTASMPCLKPDRRNGRIGAMHMRNVKCLAYRHFRETAQLSSTGEKDMYEIMKAIYDTCPDTFIRPDHGRMIRDVEGRPGYGLYDRALCATYLDGIREALCREHGEK